MRLGRDTKDWEGFGGRGGGEVGVEGGVVEGWRVGLVELVGEWVCYFTNSSQLANSLFQC